MEMEEVYSAFDLLYTMWEPMYSGIRNLKLILNFLSKYAMNQANNHRKHEARKMKHIITELMSLWSQNGPVKIVYKYDLHDCINLISTASLKSEFSKDFLSEESFNEWSHDYKKYLKDTFTNNKFDIPTTSKTIDHGPSTTNNETKTKEREKGDFDLFDSIFQKYEEDVRIQQYIKKKSENERLNILESPGETGSDCEIITVDIFNVNDVWKINKREWWRLAKVRTQFLISTSPTDHKRQLLNQLLDQFANELKNIAGLKRYEIDTR